MTEPAGDHTPKHARDFIDDIRTGYFSQHGDFVSWVAAVRQVLPESPTLFFVASVVAGSLLRRFFPEWPGGLLHLRGGSTTGKTQALRLALSFRANPHDMTWCFDTVATLKWYTTAADQNFLCMDDAHFAIMPDGCAGAHPFPPSYVQQVCDGSPGNPTCTVLTVSPRSLYELTKTVDTPALEINANTTEFAIWPYKAHRDPWWMDVPMQELYQHYGWAAQNVLAWALTDLERLQHRITEVHTQWMAAWPQYAKADPSTQALLRLAQMGEWWLNAYVLGEVPIDGQAYRKRLLAMSGK